MNHPDADVGSSDSSYQTAMKLHNLYSLTCLLLSSVLGSTQYRLKSGELFTAGEHDTLRPNIKPEQDPPAQFQTLLARQVCYAPKIYCGFGCCGAGLWCCEQTSCLDASTHTCCSGGTQCLIGKECCGGGCVSNYLPPHCVRRLTGGVG